MHRSALPYRSPGRTGRQANEARGIADRAPHVAGVMQHAPRIDDVEHSESSRPRVEHRRDLHAPVGPGRELRQQRPRRRGGVLVNVDGLDARCAHQQRRQTVQARSAPDVEKRLARKILRRHKSREPGEGGIDAGVVDRTDIALPVGAEFEVRIFCQSGSCRPFGLHGSSAISNIPMATTAARA